MEKNFFEFLLSRLIAPEKVVIRVIDSKCAFIDSIDSMNDSYDWFYVNSNLIEEALQKKGLAWCYMFETAPNKFPCIYMFIGEGLSKEYAINVMNELKEITNTLPDDRNLYYEDVPFSSIDIDKYDNSITEFEQELTRKASDVFRVYEL